MGIPRPSRLALLATPIAVAALMSGCVSEKVVYRDRSLFETPPAEAANFVGYTDVSAKLTVCGNCHVGQQAEWETTVHSTAWADLQASGHASATCEGCHTVNGNGNAADNPAGWVATPDERYQDVQCEACHGPGLDHVTTPDRSEKPLAPISVGLDLTQGCGECHQGTHHPFVEEWSQSAHAHLEDSHVVDNTSCNGCHTAEGALAAWGVNANYKEKADLGPGKDHEPIVCAVCHDPHDKIHEGQLRFAVDEPSEEGNLCMKCHHKRGTPDPSTFRGAHSPEGPVLLGYAGWWPPNMEFPGGAIVATHGSEANPKLCAGCHVQGFDVTDESGNFVIHATGHLFQAIPCLDENGAPTAGDCSSEQRTFRTCVNSGCHGSEQVARSLKATAELRIETLAEELAATLEKVQPNWNTCRSSGCGPFNTSDGVYTTAEGAAFNYDLAVYPGSAVHNPFLLEALLTSTIKQVAKDYNVTPSGNVVLENTLQQH